MYQKIVDSIKKQYSRDLRKQIVKTILNNEKRNDKEDLDSSYKIINQIFSYIISQLNWSIPDNTNNWDDTPHKIIIEVFPKIETTKWFKEQQLSVSKSIKLKENFS